MLVIKDMGGDTPDGVNDHLKIEEYSEPSTTHILMYGINSTINSELQQKYNSFTYKNLLNLWQPCEFSVTRDRSGHENGFRNSSYFTKVYTICPYTADWLNNIFGEPKHEAIFYPFNKKVIPNPQEKIYDVCYFGGLHGVDHYECIDQIQNFNYRFISQHRYDRVTNYNVPFNEKLKIIAQTKISVCYNLLHYRQDQQQRVKQYTKWDENIAFQHMDDFGRVPQFKQRVHESAFSKTLILCKRDQWNIIERYYTPNEDFIYFDHNYELKELIGNILNNYEDYKPIIENAYKKSLNYTSEKLYEHIKHNKIWK